MAKKLTKTQINRLAILWGASMMANAGMDSFNEDDMSNAQQGEVIKKMETIAFQLLGNMPLLNSLTEMINYVRQTK